MARSCSNWSTVLISISPVTGESPKISRRRVILATGVVSPQVRTVPSNHLIDRITNVNESEIVEFRLIS